MNFSKTRRKLLHRSVLAFAGATLLTVQANAAVILTLSPVGGSKVTAGAVVPVQVYLDGGPTTSAIAGLQFNVSPITGSTGATFTSGPSTADGFDESPVAAQLDFPIDGSLTDNLTIALAAAAGTGITVGSNHVLIGTFWLKTPGAVAGSYTVGLDSAQITTTSPVEITNISANGATIVASVPEPVSASVVLLGVLGYALKRKQPSAARMNRMFTL